MIDFTDAPKLKKGYGGANGNKISIMLNGSRWMLKFPSISERSPELHYTKGCISEYIGSHIFQSTGISAQDTLLGTYFINGSEKTVVACRDFVEPGFELQDFASLKNQMVDSARSGYGTEVTCSHPPCNFAARGGGFSLKATDVASIDELSPCAPRFRFL